MRLNLDVDGVLADEDGFLNGRTPTFDEAQTHGFYMERKPLWTGESLASRLDGIDVQIVSKRPKWVEATTLVWLQVHYPWLVPFIRALVCVGPHGSKLVGLDRPDIAIDDSANALRAYMVAKVPVIGVLSSQSDWCQRSVEFDLVPFAKQLDGALQLVSNLPVRHA